jgi:outer membrane protein
MRGSASEFAMRRRLVPLWFCGLLVFGALRSTPVGAAEGLNLDDYFAAALKRSEVVATQVELIRQAEERYQQASAALYPTVTGLASYTRQEAVQSRTPSGSEIPSREPLVALNATQPLFRGFREFAALRQTQALIGAQKLDYDNARLQLFKDVAQNFFNVLSLERELVNLGKEIEQNQQREREIQARVRIGRSRAAEILTVQSAISTLRAEAEQLRGQRQIARETFAFLSGLDQATSLRDTEAQKAELEPLDVYLGRIDLRPDVRAGRQRLAAARENVDVASGERLPSVDLTGNYYFKRSGSLEDVNWDVGIAVTVPLYTGGAVQSRVREAASQRTEAELTVSQTRRLAEQEIRASYQSIVYDRAQIEALARATEAAQKNYEAQAHDYRLGLVTNLDVLQALTALQQNQRALDRARYAMQLDYTRLQAAAVRRPTAQEDPHS